MANSTDPRLPGLSAADTRWLVRTARQVLADLGHAASVLDGVALEVPGGPVVGLDNLARTLPRLPRRAWARAVRNQLAALIASDPTRPIDDADLRVALWPRDRDRGWLEYEPLEPLPGLVAVLAARGDGVTTEFGRLDMLGDREAAYDRALTNVASLRLPRHARRRVHPGLKSSWVEFLESPDPFGAARVLVLPDLLRSVLGCDFPPQGVLVAVPTKFDLWIHVPVDEMALVTAAALARQAFEAWSQQPYPISPDVFLVSPDMTARRLLTADRESADLDAEAALDLDRAMRRPEAS